MSQASGNHLIRQIGLGSGIAVVVGSTIGSGIFKSPAGIAEKLPGPLPMLLVWIVGGLLVLCGALTLGEVGSAFPYSGGLYVYIREAYGRIPAFLFGWAQLVLLRPSSIGAVAVVCGQYALKLTSLDEKSPEYLYGSAGIAILAILVVTIANVRGVKLGTKIQDWTTIIKTGGLVALIVLALGFGFTKGTTHFTPALPSGSLTLSMFGLALVSTLWAYDGWADGSYVGGEMKDPKRNLPKAILFGTLIVIGVYLMANIGYLAIYSVGDIAGSQGIAADVMRKLVGPFGATFIIATVMISTFGTLNGSVLTSPRIFYALSEDKLFFEGIGKVHPKYQTPYVSVVLCGALGILYVVIATAMTGVKAFGTLTDAFVIGIVPFYALSVGSVFVFRKREVKRRRDQGITDDSLVDPIEPGHPETHPHPYKPAVHVPLYPLVPILFIASTAFLLVNSLVDTESRNATIITIVLVLIGIPIYFASIARSRT